MVFARRNSKRRPLSDAVVGWTRSLVCSGPGIRWKKGSVITGRYEVMLDTFYVAIYLREKGLRGRTRRIEKLSRRRGGDGARETARGREEKVG